jgi:hypothetical protein
LRQIQTKRLNNWGSGICGSNSLGAVGIGGCELKNFA